MPNKLVNMKIHEVSAVDKAANGRKFLIMKRDETVKGGEVNKMADEASLKDKLFNFVKNMFGDEEGAKDLNQVLLERNTDDILWDLTSAFRESVYSIVADKNTVDKKTAVLNSLNQLFGALVDTGVVKSENKLTVKQKEIIKTISEQLNSIIKGDDYNMSTTDIPEEITKRMENLEKRNKELEEQIKKAADEAKMKEFIAKAAAFDKLGIKADELGPVLKSIAELNSDGYAKIEATLSAANEQIAKGALFAEAGIDGGGESDIVKRVEAQAKEIQKRDGCSIEKARAKVYKENPELYAEYQKEMFGGR